MGEIRVTDVVDVVDNRQQFFRSFNSGPIVKYGFPALSQWFTLGFGDWSPLVLPLMLTVDQPAVGGLDYLWMEKLSKLRTMMMRNVYKYGIPITIDLQYSALSALHSHAYLPTPTRKWPRHPQRSTKALSTNVASLSTRNSSRPVATTFCRSICLYQQPHRQRSPTSWSVSS